MSERMSNERAIEILKTIRHNSTMQTDYTIDDIDQALDIAIESLEEDKLVLLQCTNGRIFVVDSKKSIDDLTSESCKKCKRIDELKEIRMENKIFTENYFKVLEPYERKESE